MEDSSDAFAGRQPLGADAAHRVHVGAMTSCVCTCLSHQCNPSSHLSLIMELCSIIVLSCVGVCYSALKQSEN